MIEPFLCDLEAVSLFDFVFGKGVVKPHALVSKDEGDKENED